MATIFIENLRVDTIIGICEWELDAEQPLYFDVEMEADIAPAAATDSIDQALDYAAVAEYLTHWVKQDNNKLLESMIVGLADNLMGKFKNIAALTLAVRKPQAIDAADAVGIRIRRERHNH